jgi:hypothetical protein
MPARDGVVQQTAASAGLSERLTAAQHGADMRLSSSVDKVNTLDAGRRSQRADRESGRRRGEPARSATSRSELSKIADVTVTENADGNMGGRWATFRRS